MNVRRESGELLAKIASRSTLGWKAFYSPASTRPRIHDDTVVA